MTYHLVFDTTDPKSPRFIELEDSTGHSISAGEWRERKDGYVELVLPAPLSKDCTQTSVTPAKLQEPVGYMRKSAIKALRDTNVESFEGVHTMVSRYPNKYNTEPLYTAPASEPVWQDIATAPRDGTRIIGAFWSICWADSHRKGDVVACWWQPEFDAFISSCRQMTMAEGYTINGKTSELHSPTVEPITHWMPLPPPKKPLSYEGEQS